MKITTINVTHEICEGYHVYTSDDLKELLVVSKDTDAGYRDVLKFIKEIFKLRDGIQCEVSRVQSLSEFVGREAEVALKGPFGSQFAVSAYA